MKKTIAGWLLLLPLTIACARVPVMPPSLEERAPQVLDVLPGSGERLPLRPRLAVVFSEPLDAESVGAESILLAKGVVDMKAYDGPSALFKAIDKGTLAGIPLTFYLQPGGVLLVLDADTDEEFLPDETYSLLVTSRVLSRERIPLRQEIAETPGYYLATWQTVKDQSAPLAPDIMVPEVPRVPGSSATAPEAPDLGPEASLPKGPVPMGPISTALDPVEPAPAGPVPVESVRPPEAVLGRVVLNEIFYDAAGGDTDGILFVELFGTAGLPIGGYRISFVNGDDGKVTESITLPEGATLAPNGFYLVADAKTGSPSASNVLAPDLIDNFDPQNGPDAVQLVGPSDELVDAVGYGEGIAPQSEDGLASFEGKPAPDVAGGHSLERRSAGFDTGDNAADFVDQAAPTPGR